MMIWDMQELCRNTMNFAAQNIKAGMTIAKLRELCENYMLKNGADSFWYWGVGAFIFSGTDTVMSVSGREYTTPDKVINENDIITIDLSPQHNNIWGDYARTIIVEDGEVITDSKLIKNFGWHDGVEFEIFLHEAMVNFVDPSTTFDELYHFANDTIAVCGFENLDFLGNLGHSIVRNKDERIYIENGNHKKLSEVEAFTFEPHIRRPEQKFGYKMENVYCFDRHKLIEL